MPRALSIGAMNTFSDSAATALQLIAGADPLLLSIVALTLMAATATMGGEVRHPEMMAEGAPSSVENT